MNSKPCSRLGCANRSLDYHSYCSVHLNERQRLFLRTPQGKLINKRATLFWRYGITYEEVEAQLKAQGGKCAICNRPLVLQLDRQPRDETPCVDHDHKTNTFRGILCDPCNKGLGNFQDDPELLAKAVEYLKRP